MNILRVRAKQQLCSSFLQAVGYQILEQMGFEQVGAEPHCSSPVFAAMELLQFLSACAWWDLPERRAVCG